MPRLCHTPISVWHHAVRALAICSSALTFAYATIIATNHKTWAPTICLVASSHLKFSLPSIYFRIHLFANSGAKTCVSSALRARMDYRDAVLHHSPFVAYFSPTNLWDPTMIDVFCAPEGWPREVSSCYITMSHLLTGLSCSNFTNSALASTSHPHRVSYVSCYKISPRLPVKPRKPYSPWPRQVGVGVGSPPIAWPQACYKIISKSAMGIINFQSRYVDFGDIWSEDSLAVRLLRMVFVACEWSLSMLDSGEFGGGKSRMDNWYWK